MNTIEFNLAESQIVIGKELVRQFVELVANFDDETYINDFYEVTEEFDCDDDEDDTSSVVWYYCYRSDIVGYIGEMNIIGDDEAVEWTPHNNLKKGN